MAKQLFSNNGKGKLNVGITNVATTLTLQAGQGALFPNPTAGDWFVATLIDTAGAIEIVKVTQRTTDVFDVMVRAQEGTSAIAFATADRVENRWTKGSAEQFLQEAEGAAVASATTTDIWVADGNTKHITGTTTITSFGTAPKVGAWAKVIFDGALTLTHGANLNLPGGANITTAADDFAFVYADTTTQFDVLYFKKDGTAVAAAITTAPRLLENIGLAVTMAANAVTIALKGANGSDPAATNTVRISFRNATLTTGQASNVSVTAALSTVISSGSTGGTVSAEASRIWIGAILVSGAAELAWFQSRSGTSIAPINEGGVITTTAEGGAGAADSAQTWYSTTARAAVPVTILGYFDSTQTTAGTWAAAADVIAVNPRYRPGDVVQTTYTQTGAVATGTTVLPNDDTIPQITEGDQYMSLAITPLAAANVLQIDVVPMLSQPTAGAYFIGTALFQDATANALAAQPIGVDGSGVGRVIATLSHRMVAATISATTFRFRAGISSANTVTFNGSSGARLFGGVISSWMKNTEICT